MSNPLKIGVTDETRGALIARIMGKLQAEGCGVCEKSGGDVFWFSLGSHCAHSVCYSEIKAIEADLIATIGSIFKENGDRNMAHLAAIRAVKKELGSVSIKKFLEKNGAERLKSIFDSVGIAAARAYYS